MGRRKVDTLCVESRWKESFRDSVLLQYTQKKIVFKVSLFVRLSTYLAVAQWDGGGKITYSLSVVIGGHAIGSLCCGEPSVT